MANSVDPDDMACYEPSNLDLHCFHRCLFQSAALKGLTLKVLMRTVADNILIFFLYVCIFQRK